MQLLPLLLQVLFLQAREQFSVVRLIAPEIKRGLVGHQIYLTGKALSRGGLAQARAPAELAAAPPLVKVGLLDVVSGLLSDLEHASLQLRILPALLQLPLDVEMVHPGDNLCGFLLFLIGEGVSGVSELGEGHICVVVVLVVELDGVRLGSDGPLLEELDIELRGVNLHLLLCG